MVASDVIAWAYYFLEPMLYEPGLGTYEAGVIVSRQMNPRPR
jgi:hypothetical protein